MSSIFTMEEFKFFLILVTIAMVIASILTIRMALTSRKFQKESREKTNNKKIISLVKKPLTTFELFLMSKEIDKFIEILETTERKYFTKEEILDYIYRNGELK